MYSDGYLRTFEFVIIALVLITGIGFTAGLFINPPNFQSALTGLKPMLSGDDGILLAVGIIGATIMPHAIYAHSALSRDRFRNQKSENFRYLIKVTSWDVSLAMLVAGAVNLGILFLGAENLHGVIIKDSIQGAYGAIGNSLGTVIATLFAVGLLASGLASSSVGTFAGGVIVSGLTTQQLPIWIRRSITLIPALLIIGLGTNPTQSLILSQVILSFGIPFALYPLVKLTSQESIMGELRNHSLTTLLAYVIMMFISALNAYLVILQIVRGLT
jgi:manganese transport protein